MDGMDPGNRSVTNEIHDLCVVGGGIVGLATAWAAAQRRPGTSIIVLEKEAELAFHQTGRNSGVIHSGIYYTPGSLKARTCRSGRAALIEFCREHRVAYELCGKVVVALDDSELPMLERIHQRGIANGVKVELLDGQALREIEPHVAGIRGIRVPDTGIVDYRGMCEALCRLVCEAGGEVGMNTRVAGLVRDGNHLVIDTNRGPIRTRQVVNCGGLQSDRLARTFAGRPEMRIVPFRGEYYTLTEGARHLCRHLIYPVPDPAFPFLGVHFTRMISGEVECGPNAVLAAAREGYHKTSVHLPDLYDTLSYPGFWRLASRHLKTGLAELWRSWSKDAFVRALQRLIPELGPADLEPAPSGIRAQALKPNGELVDDFLLEEQAGVLNVLNAPSPAATASLSIGEAIVDRLEGRRSAERPSPA
ncbi:MAG: L-2-hydroxyglutarate oxidase [Planctomycetota bacterium]|nr:L-2-hydroxyglutarate oxidase [Planctomycetota bacterium]